MRQTISILGSTGSIGLTSLDLIDRKKNKFIVFLLAANKKFRIICRQINKYKPKYFIISDKKILSKVKKKFKKKNIKFLNKFDEISLKKKIDITISAIPGLEGLQPTISMTKISKRILIANKESVICGWGLIKKIANKYKTKIIPIDSEHFSIFKLIKNHSIEDIKKIYITASGGPFLNFEYKDLKKVQPKAALKHPKWKMGKKISIDSATMMNKILEIIEAQKLFNIPNNKIDILIHPESLVHAIIELKNGLSQFIYHDTTMKIPLANAIFEKKLDIQDFKIFKKNNRQKVFNKLTFSNVDKKNFPIIKIKDRANEYPSTSIILNAANEILVEYFLQKKLPFLSISKIILTIMNDRNYYKYAIRKPKNINQIKEIDLWVKKRIIDNFT